MKISDGMGSHLSVVRTGSRVHIDAIVGLWPLAINWAVFIGIIVLWRWRKK